MLLLQYWLILIRSAEFKKTYRWLNSRDLGIYVKNIIIVHILICDLGAQFWYCGPGGSFPRWSQSGWMSRTHPLTWRKRIKVTLNMQMAELIGLGGVCLIPWGVAIEVSQNMCQVPSKVKCTTTHHAWYNEKIHVEIESLCWQLWASGCFWHFWRELTAG